MRSHFSLALASILLMTGTALADVPPPSSLSRLSTPFCGSTLIGGAAMALAVASGGILLARRRTTRRSRPSSKS